MIGYDKDQKHFNSHPHEEDDVCAQKLEKPLYEYFNSHPHEEDDAIR